MVAIGRIHRRLRPVQAGRALVLLLTGAWVVVLNNARISDNFPDHAAYSWLRIPRETRLLEAGLLLAVFAILQPRLMRSRIRDLNWLLWVLISTSAIAIWLTPTYLPAQLQGIYVYVAPFLIFAVAWEASPTRRLLGRLIALFCACTAVSIAVGLFVQFPAVGAKGDWVHGFFSDAHVFGSFLAIGSCVAFSVFLEEGGIGYLLGAGALLVVSYFPANEKVIIFNVLWCGGVLAWRLVTHPRGWRGWAATTAASLLVLVVAFGRASGSEPLLRFNLLEGHTLSELGPARAWVHSWSAIADSPIALVIGLGPGNYAGLAAARAIQERPNNLKLLSMAAREVLLEEPGEGGAVAWVTNTWSNLLAEFGLLGFGVFALALCRLVLPLCRWKPPPGFDRRAQILFFVMLGVILWQGCVSPYTNWAEPVLVYPMMAVAAYCHRVSSAASNEAPAS